MYFDSGPLAVEKGKGKPDMKKMEEKRCLENALELLQGVQKMHMMDGEKMAGNKKAKMMLMQARGHIDDMLGETKEKKEKPMKEMKPTPTEMRRTMAA